MDLVSTLREAHRFGGNKALYDQAADELAEAVRLLHVLRAYSWTAGNLPDPAREDPLYPAEWLGRDRRGKLWQAVDVLLKKHPYSPVSASDDR